MIISQTKWTLLEEDAATSSRYLSETGGERLSPLESAIQRWT